MCEETLTGEVGAIVSTVDDIIPDQWRNTRDEGGSGASTQHVRDDGGRKGRRKEEEEERDDDEPTHLNSDSSQCEYQCDTNLFDWLQDELSARFMEPIVICFCRFSVLIRDKIIFL